MMFALIDYNEGCCQKGMKIKIKKIIKKRLEIDKVRTLQGGRER
jgi:hypothetical protein